MKFLNKKVVSGDDSIKLIDSNLFLDELRSLSEADYWINKFHRQDQNFCIIQYTKQSIPMWALFREDTYHCRIVSIDAETKIMKVYSFDDDMVHNYNYRKCNFKFIENQVLNFKKKSGKLVLVNRNFLVRDV